MAPKVFKRGLRAIKKAYSGASSKSPPRTESTSQIPDLDEASKDIFGPESGSEEMDMDPQVADDRGKAPMEESSSGEEDEDSEEGSGESSGSEMEESEKEEGDSEEEEEETVVVVPETVETTTRAAKKSRTAEEELRGSEPRFLSAEAKARYERLKKKKIENSRCLDPRVLQQLGIEADFYALTENAGITRAFWEIVEPSYTRLTMEFLCTFQLEWLRDRGEHKASWQFHGVPYSMYESEIADIFGLRRGGLDVRDEDEGFWEKITGLRAPKQKKSLDFQMPVIRFIQRALSLSIFARGEPKQRQMLVKSPCYAKCFAATGRDIKTSRGEC